MDLITIIASTHVLSPFSPDAVFMDGLVWRSCFNYILHRLGTRCNPDWLSRARMTVEQPILLSMWYALVEPTLRIQIDPYSYPLHVYEGMTSKMGSPSPPKLLRRRRSLEPSCNNTPKFCQFSFKQVGFSAVFLQLPLS
jgi:hypothetical protein